MAAHTRRPNNGRSSTPDTPRNRNFFFHRMDPAHLPHQITHTRQWYQQEPPEDTPSPAFLLLIGGSRRLAIQRAGQPIPIGTVRPQRISFGCPPEQIVHITIIVFHN
jgi:hypothetical protein